MSEDIGELKKFIVDAEKGYKTFHAKAKSTLADIKKYQAQVKGIPATAPNVKKKGWLKKAEKAKASSKVTAALKKVESAGTRASCVDALKAINSEKGNKDVDAIGAEIDKILKTDEKNAKILTKQQAAVKAMKSEAAKLKGPGPKVEAKAQALAKQVAVLVKEIKADKG